MDNKRPMPPDYLGDYRDGKTVNFTPATGLKEWVMDTLIKDEAPLHNPDHKHLLYASFDLMWAAEGFEKQMRTIIGQTEEITFRCGPWQKGRQEQQMREWFGYAYPDYLITLDANFCAHCSDIDFLALIEHELYHIGQKTEFGAPAFDKAGFPKLGIRGHDVEEFVGVVSRYGMSPEVKKLVDAANKGPQVSQLNIAQACGTCLRRVA